MNRSGLIQQLLVACLAILLAALALRWTVQIIEEIWPQLAIGAGVVLSALGLVALHRWRRNRW